MTVETVFCWKWHTPGYKSTYTAEHVLTLRDMVRRHYPFPHRFVCVTDDPRGLESIDTLSDWRDFAEVQSPHGAKNPSCYRRLRMFHPEAARWFGRRFVSLDLDTVITGDLSQIWNRTDDFVMWGDTSPRTHYNGSMVLMTAGARPTVWTEFDPVESPTRAKAAGQFGSDQGWIGYRLGPGEAKWSKADGVYSFRNDLRSRDALPVDARIVFFHGRVDPWSPEAKQYRWVREHYRRDVEAVDRARSA